MTDAVPQISRGTRGSLVLLAAAIIAGAYVRFEGLHEPSYWLDEMLGEQLTRRYAELPWWRWLLGLEREHGPLYYLTQLIAPGRVAAAVFGVVTIPLVWLLAKRVHSDVAASMCALLIAFSPLHVYYSREARPYALVMMLAAALLVSSRTAPFLISLFALIYTSAVAAPVIAAIAVALWLFDRKRHALYAIASLPLFAMLYRGAPPTSPAATFPSLDADFFLALGRAFTVSAINSEGRGRTMVGLIVLAMIGAVALLRRNRRAAFAVLAATVLPVVLPLIALGALGHWFAVRYVAAALVGFLVLVSIGISACLGVRRQSRRFPTAGLTKAVALPPQSILAVLITVVIAYELYPVLQREPREKLDWRAIAATIREHAKSGDRIIAAEPWSDASLRFYLGELPGVRMGLIDDAYTAEVATYDARGTWFVSAGYAGHSRVRELMCQYPLVLAHPIENFRLHYAPDARHFLRHRTGSAEQLAIAAAFSGTLEMHDDALLGEGWAAVEGAGRDAFRWAIAREATVLLPVRDARDRRLRIRALPHGQQTMQLAINGRAHTTMNMTSGWRDYIVDVPAALWRAGINELQFRFAHASVAAPHDPRTLAAAVDAISIGGTSKERPTIPHPRLATPLIWRDPELPSRFPAGRLRREHAWPLLGRLGYDPAALWPRITSGEIRLDDVIAGLAWGSDCEDPRAFLHRAFAILLERSPSAFEEQDLLRAMQDGWSRPRIAVRIARSEEFGKTMLMP